MSVINITNELLEQWVNAGTLDKNLELLQVQLDEVPIVHNYWEFIGGKWVLKIRDGNYKSPEGVPSIHSFNYPGGRPPDDNDTTMALKELSSKK